MQEDSSSEHLQCCRVWWRLVRWRRVRTWRLVRSPECEHWCLLSCWRLVRWQLVRTWRRVRSPECKHWCQLSRWRLPHGAGSPTWQSSFSCMVAKLLGACRTLASCTLLVRWPLGFWRLCASGTLAACTLASVRFWYAGCLYSGVFALLVRWLLVLGVFALLVQHLCLLVQYFWYSISACPSSISGTAFLPFRPAFLCGSGEQRQQEVRRHCDS